MAAAPTGLPVIIIGAGVAGLRAAQLLRHQGVPATMLEAKGTIGGRMCTVPYHNAWLEMGASWLHSYHQHPFRTMVKKLGLRTVFTNYNQAHTFPGVQRDDTWHTKLQQAIKRAAKQPKDAPLESFLTNLSTSMRATAMLEAEMYYGASLNKLSGWNFDEGEETKNEDYLLLGGWVHWLQAQAKGLEIRLNTPVATIEATKAGLRVTTTHGTTLEACAVINTAPLGVLQQPTQQAALLPALPPRHRQAIAALGMGNLEKLFFTAPIPSWPRHDVMLLNHPLLPLWYDVTPLLGTPMLMGLAGMGALEALPKNPSAADWLALATPALRQMIPHGPLPTMVAHSAWQSDPFSHGSYSYYKVGSSPADRKTLQKPWLGGRYWLAGEHTDTAYPANIQGAWRSGERVAKALLKEMSLKTR